MSRIESRRFRTWQSEREVPTPPWRIILKYGYLRMFKTWYMAVLLVLIAVGAIVTVGAASYWFASDPSGVPWWAISESWGIFGVGMGLILLVIGSGLFSEDLRFPAPLFYFSKPLGVRDYMLGKLVQLGSLLLMAGVLPVILLLLMANIGSIDSQAVDWRGQPLTGRGLLEWEISHINGFQDWAYTWFFTVAGVLSTVFFTTSLMVYLSSITQRAWHAAMAFVAVLGGWTILGSASAIAVRDVRENLMHPFGWMESVLSLPMRIRFDPYLQASFLESSGSRLDRLDYYDPAGVTIIVSHVLLVGIGFLALYLTYHRLRRVEGVL